MIYLKNGLDILDGWSISMLIFILYVPIPLKKANFGCSFWLN